MAEIDPDRWIKEPSFQDEEFSLLGTTLSHLDGVPWFEAPIPSRMHRCWPQTIAWLGLDQIFRCPCGALRNTRFQGWLECNSRKRGEPIPEPGTYIARKQAEVDQWESLAGVTKHA